MTYESVEVPFHTCGNRRYLTRVQLYEDDALKAFYERFKHRFEVDPYRDLYWLIEEDNERAASAARHG